MTSHDVVNRLRRLPGKSLLVISERSTRWRQEFSLVSGKYTRLAQYFSSANKSYTGVIRFGYSTDTYDAEGQPEGPDCSPALALDHVRHAAAEFLGETEQMPPPYSAKKIAGVPAYKLARAGKAVELKAAKVRITSFEIVGVEGANAAFAMTITAGGYVRSVAHEIGQKLGCGAHLSVLRRMQAGVFTLEQAHTLEEMETISGNIEAFESFCIHPRSLLPEMPAVTGDAQALGRLRNGAQAEPPGIFAGPISKGFCRAEGIGRNREEDCWYLVSTDCGSRVATPNPATGLCAKAA